MLRDFIKLMLILTTLLFNVFLIWILLYNPFTQLLLDKNQPYHDPPASTIIVVINFAVILVLVISSVYLTIVFFRRKKLFIASPIFSVVVILTLLAIRGLSLNYPSSIFYETKNGHFYINEIWWNQPNHKRTFKRWKSIRPYDQKLDPTGRILSDTSMHYTLDSFSESADKTR